MPGSDATDCCCVPCCADMPSGFTVAGTVCLYTDPADPAVLGACSATSPICASFSIPFALDCADPDPLCPDCYIYSTTSFEGNCPDTNPIDGKPDQNGYCIGATSACALLLNPGQPNNIAVQGTITCCRDSDDTGSGFVILLIFGDGARTFYPFGEFGARLNRRSCNPIILISDPGENPGDGVAKASSTITAVTAT